MALIGNPMDFDRIRRTYESITYPESRKTFQTPFEQTRSQYSGLLTGTGSETIRQDAAQPGEQIQFRFNPVTGQTETIIPEYMGTYRTDQKDFFPGSSPFESIYSTGDSEIDPATGRLRETTEQPLAMQSLPSLLSGDRGDDPRGEGPQLGFGRYGDRFTPAPGFGKAYDEYGRLRNIGKPRDALVNTFDAMKPIGNYIKSGGIIGNVVKGLKEFSLSDLVSNTNQDNDKPDTTSKDTDVSGGISDAQKRSGSRGDGRQGRAGGRSGGRAGGSAGAGGAGGRAKGGRYT